MHFTIRKKCILVSKYIEVSASKEVINNSALNRIYFKMSV